MKQWQRYLAELFGTFILVFGGTTSVLAAARFGGGAFTEFIVPFGFGLEANKPGSSALPTPAAHRLGSGGGDRVSLRLLAGTTDIDPISP